MRMALGWIVLLAASPRLKIQISRGGFVKAIQGAEKQTRADKHPRDV